MKLDDAWIEEFARTSFSLWESITAERTPGYIPREWETTTGNDGTDSWKEVWRDQSRKLAGMMAEFLLLNQWHFFNDSSGDLGAAHVRALQRYAMENHEYEVRP